MRFLKPTLSAFLIALLLSGTVAEAQTEPSKAPEPKHENLDLVTEARPTVRQHCHVVSDNHNKIVCKRAFGKSKTYSYSDLVAIIDPAENVNREIGSWLGFWLPATGVCIYFAIVAASIAATAGISIAAFVAFDIAFVGLMGAGNGNEHDTILYLRTGTTLGASIHLK
jgi:hypothetical protein